MSDVARYIPEAVRHNIERYYARVNAQADLDALASNSAFLQNPTAHVGIYSDHGVVHVRDVANNILMVLDAIHGVLMPERSAVRISFMKGYGAMLAYNHDIGMMDFSAFGRAMHPEFAAQEIFSPAYDEIVDIVWGENWGNLAWRLLNLEERHLLAVPAKLVLRELLSMSVGHSKSKVPIEAINNPPQLRQVMLTTVSTQLQHLYHDQQISKAEKKLNKLRRENAPADKIASAQTEVDKVRAARDSFVREHPNLSRRNPNLARFYDAFEATGYAWITNSDPEMAALLQDVTDTIRALRVADALRQRGTSLKTSGGYQIFADRSTAHAIFALQKRSGELFLLESAERISSGEANVASSEVTRGGDLRLSFQRGMFMNAEAVQFAAHNAALLVDDIQRDIVDTFTRPPGQFPALKPSDDIQILLEETDDNLAFATMILAELQEINPETTRRSRVVPSLKNIAAAERDRYIQAADLDWSPEVRHKLLVRIAQAGYKVQNVDVEKAFSDVRLATLQQGETLVAAGASPAFVYIPLGEGFTSTPLGGYQPVELPPYIPFAYTRVISGAPQEATVATQHDVEVLMIPKEIYLKYWHNPYQVDELMDLLPRLYSDNARRGLDHILEILKQMAMIDAQLDDNEVEFIRHFAESNGIPYTAQDIKRELSNAGAADFIQLRQRVMDYLGLGPAFGQVAQLRDLISLLAKADANVSDEEKLILSELLGLFAGYIEDNGSVTHYDVLIVPQSDDQDKAIATLLPDLERQQVSGGFAYSGGMYYAEEYANMVADRYRALNFFCTVTRTQNGNGA